MEPRIKANHRKNFSLTPPKSRHRRTHEIADVSSMKTRSLDALDEPVKLLEKQ